MSESNETTSKENSSVGDEATELEATENAQACSGAGTGDTNTSKGNDKPANNKDKNDQEEPGEDDSAPTAKHALIVEDARIIRRMLVKIMNHAGFQCDEAENGYEALALLRKAKSCGYSYNIIATDLMMPEMDGWGLIEQLKERKVFPNTPVIVITAASTVESVRKCMEFGIKHFVVKPFQAEKVIATVEKALSSKEVKV